MIGSMLLAVATAAPVTYALQPDKSWLYVVVTYDRDKWSAVAVHDHVARASSFTGTVAWDTESPSACDIRIEFPVTSLVIDPPGAREREELDPNGAVTEADKHSIVKNMLSGLNLDASRFATITYRSASCAPRADGGFDVTGDLSIRGATKRVTTAMVIRPEADSFAASGEVGVTHADFGMKPFTIGGLGLPGAPRNAEALRIVVDVVGVRPPGAVPAE
jgi:polyisoprenoid-binding protein YceI